MPRSRVTLLSWVVAIAFLLATALIYVDRLNLVATPPVLPEEVNLVDRMLGLESYRQAIWPVFFWTNLLFAIGFIASVALVVNVASAWSGLPTFLGLAITGGVMAAIASVIPIGAVNASVWQLTCDCVGFKETEIVSGVRAQMVAEDVGVWLNRVASIVLALGLLALIREAGARISPALRTVTYLLAVALVVAPVLGIIQRTDPIAEELITLVAGAVLVPVWAVWLARTVEGSGPAST